MCVCLCEGLVSRRFWAPSECVKTEEPVNKMCALISWQQAASVRTQFWKLHPHGQSVGRPAAFPFIERVWIRRTWSGADWLHFCHVCNNARCCFADRFVCPPAGRLLALNSRSSILGNGSSLGDPDGSDCNCGSSFEAVKKRTLERFSAFSLTVSSYWTEFIRLCRAFGHTSAA